MTGANTGWSQMLELQEKLKSQTEDDEAYVDWLDYMYGHEIEGYCDHLFINVGFNHLVMVCKYCDTEEQE